MQASLPDVHGIIDDRYVKIGDNTEDGRIKSTFVAFQSGTENKITDVHEPEDECTRETGLPIPPCIPRVSRPDWTRQQRDRAKDETQFRRSDCEEIVVGFPLDEVLDAKYAVNTEGYKNGECGRDVIVEDFLDFEHCAFNARVSKDEIE
jgi:hypothetical protein